MLVGNLVEECFSWMWGLMQTIEVRHGSPRSPRCGRLRLLYVPVLLLSSAFFVSALLMHASNGPGMGGEERVVSCCKRDSHGEPDITQRKGRKQKGKKLLMGQPMPHLMTPEQIPQDISTNKQLRIKDASGQLSFVDQSQSVMGISMFEGDLSGQIDSGVPEKVKGQGKYMSPLFQVSMEKPYAPLLRSVTASHGCQFYNNHPSYCWYNACDPEVSNCEDTVQRIAHDHLQAKEGKLPQHPMHSFIPDVVEATWVHLDQQETFNFFNADLGDKGVKRAGLLKVTEYCQAEVLGVRPDDLIKAHTYLIERHGDLCWVMQSDYTRYHIDQFMGGGLEPFPKDNNKFDFDQVRELRNYMGYDKAASNDEDSTGVDCQKFFVKMYQPTYPELTAIKAYTESCLDYYVWKGKYLQSFITNNNGTFLEDELLILEEEAADQFQFVQDIRQGWNENSRPDVPNEFRISRFTGAGGFEFCYDDDVGGRDPVLRSWNGEDWKEVNEKRLGTLPGDVLKIEHVQKLVEQKPGGERKFGDRQVSFARGLLQCVAIPSALVANDQ